MRLSADFSTETLQALRDWHEICKVMKTKDLQPRLLYPVRLPFKIEGKIQSFPEEKKKAKGLSQPVLHEMLKGLLKEELQNEAEHLSQPLAVRNSLKWTMNTNIVPFMRSVGPQK